MIRAKLLGAVRSQSDKEGPIAFTFKLEHADGAPADPPVLHTAVPNWSVGDTIPLGAERGTLRVVETRFTDDGSVLVVEPDWGYRRPTTSATG